MIFGHLVSGFEILGRGLHRTTQRKFKGEYSTQVPTGFNLGKAGFELVKKNADKKKLLIDLGFEKEKKAIGAIRIGLERNQGEEKFKS
uniref:Ntox11 domain-containing protein n=1 Tax=Haemonchus contortus TaxID=6289 RepID=A0A7I4Y831_HAECO